MSRLVFIATCLVALVGYVGQLAIISHFAGFSGKVEALPLLLLAAPWLLLAVLGYLYRSYVAPGFVVLVAGLGLASFVLISDYQEWSQPGSWTGKALAPAIDIAIEIAALGLVAGLAEALRRSRRKPSP
jgi:hypothetical protein